MVKKIKKITLQEGNLILESIITLFNRFKLTKSANQVLFIKEELNKEGNFEILNSAFKVLQTTFVVEYNTTDHRILCSTFFKKRVNLTTKFNVSGLNDIRLDKSWAKMIQYRSKSRHVLLILDKILRDGSKSDEEKNISLSYLYLSSIDGVYGKNLKDVLIYDKLSKHESINYFEMERMNMGQIQKYFKKVNGADCLFDGWDEDIRNAIAHSSFWYDSKNSRIIFEERRRGCTKKKTQDELFQMLEKLSDIDELVFGYNQIFRLNKVITDLT